MAVSVTRAVDNGNVTYTIAITAEQEKGDLIASECSERVYNENDFISTHYGGVPWSTLDPQQKMHVIGMYTQRHLRNIGYGLYHRRQVATIEDIDTHYGSET